MSARFGLRHSPPPFAAAATTFGGVIPFFNAEYAICEFGLPQRRAISKPAQAVMVIGMARITAIRRAIFTFYFGGKFEVVLLMGMSSGRKEVRERQLLEQVRDWRLLLGVGLV
jgi:hypothetical protein